MSGWMQEGAETLPYKIVHGKTIVGASTARPQGKQKSHSYEWLGDLVSLRDTFLQAPEGVHLCRACR